MYDSVFVLVEAFNKILKKKSDQFRNYTMRRTSSTLSPANTGRILDCNPSAQITPWEHGDKISKYIRKVSGHDSGTSWG